jgi:quercetin dioxygenase-like cupin family protein
MQLVRWALLCLMPLLCLCFVRAGKDEDPKHANEKDHVVVTPDKIKWGPAPPTLPPGAQIAVLVGDPKEKGPYTMRVKLPDGYKVPPHWHPSDENVTVLQGTFHIGRGEKFDAAATQELPAGSYMRMPKTMRHFAFAKGETILQLHGMGPFEINYVNPADDPRKQK